MEDFLKEFQFKPLTVYIIYYPNAKEIRLLPFSSLDDA